MRPSRKESDERTYVSGVSDFATRPFQVAAVLQVNQQLLSSQRLSLSPSAVTTLLSSPVLSRLRNHPHPAVVHAVVSTSLSLLQHDSADVAHASLSEVHREMREGFGDLTGGPLKARSVGNRDAESVVALLQLNVQLLTACAVRGLVPRQNSSGEGKEGKEAGLVKLPGKEGGRPIGGPVDHVASDNPVIAAANHGGTGPPSKKQTEQNPSQSTIQILVAFFVEAEPLPQLREALFDALQTICQAASGAGLPLQGLLAARLCALALSPATSFDLKVKALNWAQQLLDTPEPSPASRISAPLSGVKFSTPWSQSVGQTLFPALLAALSDPEEDVRERAAAILLSGLGAGLLTWQQTRELAQAAAWLKGDVSKRVADVGHALLREAGVALWLDGIGGAAAKYGGGWTTEAMDYLAFRAGFAVHVMRISQISAPLAQRYLCFLLEKRALSLPHASAFVFLLFPEWTVCHSAFNGSEIDTHESTTGKQL